MTSRGSKTLQALVQDFFVQHLGIERNAAANTVAAYRDAMKLFLRHASSEAGSDPDQLGWEVFDPSTIRSFLDWLARIRGCGPRTRNQRLAALKAFARYVALVAPEHLEQCRRIRAIPPAGFDRPEVSYLTEEEMVRLVAAPDASTPAGRRDRALLLLMYNTGGRVQEIVDLDIEDLDHRALPFVRLLGKGRKERCCPLWSRTVSAIQRMLGDRPGFAERQPLFTNARGGRLSRSGVTHLLRKAQQRADISPSHTTRVSPHVLRHTTAMHLLQSGVDLTTIAAWLGHAQLSTTHTYVEIDLRMKQEVVALAALPSIEDADYPAPHIIDWLEKLAAPTGYAQHRGLAPEEPRPWRPHSA